MNLTKILVSVRGNSAQQIGVDLVEVSSRRNFEIIDVANGLAIVRQRTTIETPTINRAIVRKIPRSWKL